MLYNNTDRLHKLKFQHLTVQGNQQHLS